MMVVFIFELMNVQDEIGVDLLNFYGIVENLVYIDIFFFIILKLIEFKGEKLCIGLLYN